MEITVSAGDGEPGKIIQIDESYFQGKRKYNRGRYLKGDKRPNHS